MNEILDLEEIIPAMTNALQGGSCHTAIEYWVSFIQTAVNNPNTFFSKISKNKVQEDCMEFFLIECEKFFYGMSSRESLRLAKIYNNVIKIRIPSYQFGLLEKIERILFRAVEDVHRERIKFNQTAGPVSGPKDS